MAKTTHEALINISNKELRARIRALIESKHKDITWKDARKLYTHLWKAAKLKQITEFN